MNPILKLALSAAVKYLESHPDEIQQLVTALFDLIVREVAKVKATS